jgi:hypothetical protein
MRHVVMVLGLSFAFVGLGCGVQKVREAGAKNSPQAGAAEDLPADGESEMMSPRIATKSDKSAPKETAAGEGGIPMMPMLGADKSTGRKLTPAAPVPHADAKAVPPTPPPAVAEAITGTARKKPAPKEPALPSGILTAGSFDDNLEPRFFLKFVERFHQQHGVQDLPALLQGQRLQVVVKDAGGKPVGGAKVQLIAKTGQAAQLVTRTDGRAVFLTSLDGLPKDVEFTAAVTPPEGGTPVSEKIDAGANRWEITLPAATARLPRHLDLAVMLDTTGSMKDEHEYLKAEIRGISKAVAARFPEVQQRFALVVYRDEGDTYVAKSFNFTPLDAFHAELSKQQANGGGDHPEAVHRGFEEANQLRWLERDAARLLFWIADAPPHAQHMTRTMNAANALRKQGIAIYPVACSGYNDPCELVMRTTSMVTGSQFLFLTDDSGVGGSHAEPKIPFYHVERLEKLMVRMIAGELSGQRLEPEAGDIIRTVGQKLN